MGQTPKKRIILHLRLTEFPGHINWPEKTMRMVSYLKLMIIWILLIKIRLDLVIVRYSHSVNYYDSINLTKVGFFPSRVLKASS